MLLSHLIVSDSVRPHRWQPTRLPCPWDSPGKKTGVGCHFLLQCMKVKSESEVAQLCPTLHDPMDCSPPGSSVHENFQATVLEWVAIAFSTLIFWEMQIKITVKYHPTPIRMAIIRKTKDNKCWWDCEEKGTLGRNIGGNTNWCRHYGKQYGGSSKN